MSQSARMDLHFFLPDTRSLRKYTVSTSWSHRYAPTSTLRKLKSSFFEANLAAKLAAASCCDDEAITMLLYIFDESLKLETNNLPVSFRVNHQLSSEISVANSEILMLPTEIL